MSSPIAIVHRGRSLDVQCYNYFMIFIPDNSHISLNIFQGFVFHSGSCYKNGSIKRIVERGNITVAQDSDNSQQTISLFNEDT